MPKEIFIDCFDNGDVSVEAEGFAGQTCSLSTKPFIEGLGMRKTSETLKQETVQGARQVSTSRETGGKNRTR